MFLVDIIFVLYIIKQMFFTKSDLLVLVIVLFIHHVLINKYSKTLIKNNNWKLSWDFEKNHKNLDFGFSLEKTVIWKN